MKDDLSVEQKAHLGRIAAKQFLAITDLWAITDSERRVLAGAATRTTISTWRKRVKTLHELQLGNDTYERLICIANIHDLLQQHTEEGNVAQRIRQAIPFFDHCSLLDKMLGGWMRDLYQVKDFLEHEANEMTLFNNIHIRDVNLESSRAN